jgi:hypothetical protein
MNDYERLEKAGWVLYYSGNKRWSYFKKKNWTVAVPDTTFVGLIFSRNGKRMSPSKYERLWFMKALDKK